MENYRVYGELGQDFGILDFRIATFVRILIGILWIWSQGKPDSVRGGPFASAPCQPPLALDVKMLANY